MCCCSVLQCVNLNLNLNKCLFLNSTLSNIIATHIRTLQHVFAVHCVLLQCVAVCCSVLQCANLDLKLNGCLFLDCTRRNLRTFAHCNTYSHTTTHIHMLQHTFTRCKTHFTNCTRAATPIPRTATHISHIATRSNLQIFTHCNTHSHAAAHICSALCVVAVCCSVRI